MITRTPSAVPQHTGQDGHVACALHLPHPLEIWQQRYSHHDSRDDGDDLGTKDGRVVVAHGRL
ncbi:hypothetical protein GQ600_9317 [Phytophthora cactorum]|nr:hypothetical protein GQ600_9317 [Phytophthora cactorum]